MCVICILKGHKWSTAGTLRNPHLKTWLAFDPGLPRRRPSPLSSHFTYNHIHVGSHWSHSALSSVWLLPLQVHTSTTYPPEKMGLINTLLGILLPLCALSHLRIHRNTATLAIYSTMVATASISDTRFTMIYGPAHWPSLFLKKRKKEGHIPSYMRQIPPQRDKIKIKQTAENNSYGSTFPCFLVCETQKSEQQSDVSASSQQSTDTTDPRSTKRFMFLCSHLWILCVQHPTLKGNKTGVLQILRSPNLSLINNAEAPLRGLFSLFLFSPSFLFLREGGAAQLDVQHSAAQHSSVDTEFNLFQGCNSIISPGSCSATREGKGGRGVFNLREEDREE